MWTLWILVLHNKYTLPQTTILSRYAFSNPFKVIFFYSCRVVGIAVLITNSLFVACKMFQLYPGTDVWISRGAHTRLMHLKGDSKFVREAVVTIFSIERLAGRNVTGANSNRPRETQSQPSTTPNIWFCQVGLFLVHVGSINVDIAVYILKFLKV